MYTKYNIWYNNLKYIMKGVEKMKNLVIVNLINMLSTAPRGNHNI